jgi:hypothetical protein
VIVPSGRDTEIFLVDFQSALKIKANVWIRKSKILLY